MARETLTDQVAARDEMIEETQEILNAAYTPEASREDMAEAIGQALDALASEEEEQEPEPEEDAD